jgi:uncharacterized membrane protein
MITLVYGLCLIMMIVAIVLEYYNDKGNPTIEYSALLMFTVGMVGIILWTFIIGSLGYLS